MNMKEYLKLVNPYISSDLISEANWNNINAVGEILPNNITSFFGFECPLSIKEATSDFLICVAAKEVGRKILADTNINHPIWQTVTQFSQEWNRETSVLHDKIHNIWLEFDLNVPPSSIPVPSFFFGSQPIYSNQSIYNIDSYQWVSEKALNLLFNQPLESRIEQQLFQCFELLPQETHVFQIGVMLARQTQQLIRVCLRGISTKGILEYLEKINWCGSISSLAEILTDLSNLVDRIDLDLDIGETVRPKIGLECYLSKQPKFEPKWQLFLDYLISKGLCFPEKAEAILNYPGYMRSPSNPILKLQGEKVYFRNIHHIKLTFEENKPLQAKAYLAVGHNVITPELVASLRNKQIITVQLDNFLSQEEHKELLNFTCEKQAEFVPSELGISETKLAIHRQSLVLFEFSKFEELIKQRIEKVLPEIFQSLKIGAFPIEHIEVQLTAHNDGDYYRVHNDNGTPESAGRVLTFVYYFYLEPKAFSGGELRIYNFVKNGLNQADREKTIEPRNNSIVFFPSGYLHEVLPVRCPYSTFTASRFTLNGWIWRKP